MTCKDCLHYEICGWYLADDMGEKSANACKYYMSHSEWVHLPRKVGDTVYVLESCICYCGYRSFEECKTKRTVRTKWIKCVMSENKNRNRCIKLFERPFRIEYLLKIGKTVFLTREEAEKALEDMRK